MCVCGGPVLGMKNKDGNSMHYGAIATLVDWVGASVVYTKGASASGVSVEINVSYYDTASVGVRIFHFFFFSFSFLDTMNFCHGFYVFLKNIVLK